MNIDEMKLGDLKRIAAMFGNAGNENTNPFIGKWCIIRTYASGVHFGKLVSQTERQVELADSRRLWKWFAVGGISLSEVAKNGIDPSKSQVCVSTKIVLLDALEIIPCNQQSISTIETAKTYTP